jgi:cysteinyl-tRNA synthetase
MDLLFPHHESEICQSNIANGQEPAKYWIHNNMITINGQKMGKSLGNFITLNEFFDGSHASLNQSYSPMTIRFFILQAHYRSTVDFSNEALQAAEKGLKKLLAAQNLLPKLKSGAQSTEDIQGLERKLYDALNDDFNSSIAIAHLFDAVRIVNSVKDGKASLTAEDLDLLKKLFNDFVNEILGLQSEEVASGSDEMLNGVMQMLIDLRQQAKANKDWATADKIRNELGALNIVLKDTKDGAEWSLE